MIRLDRAVSPADIESIRFLFRGYADSLGVNLPQMERAKELYRSLGFVPVDAYRFSPVPGTVFLELILHEG